MNHSNVEQLKVELAVAQKQIATLMEEVDNNEDKKKDRELLDTHWDQKMKQKAMTELNYDGNETRGRYGEDENA